MATSRREISADTSVWYRGRAGVSAERVPTRTGLPWTTKYRTEARRGYERTKTQKPVL
jgi:hypothetical protein